MRGPPSSSAVSCQVFSLIPACRCTSTYPDLDGSLIKQTVSGPMNTQSHHFVSTTISQLPLTGW
jgi:hypothetical protein